MLIIIELYYENGSDTPFREARWNILIQQKQDPIYIKP